MKELCQNCEHWDKIDDSTGYCKQQPVMEDYNPMADALGDNPCEITDADDSCESFEPEDRL